MSIVPTLYTTIDPYGQVVDLATIFQPIGTATPGPVTGYITEVNGTPVDISELFAPNSGPTLPFNTGYQVNGMDLRYLFAPVTFQTSGTVTYSSSYTFVTFTNTAPDANNYIQFANQVMANVLVVGGGGSGGAGGIGEVSLFSQLICGGGGQGGNVIQNSAVFLPYTFVNITVGAGGQCVSNGGGSFTPNNGAPSSITQGGSVFTAVGGNAGSNANVYNTSGPTSGGTSPPPQAAGSGGNGGNVYALSFSYSGSSATGYDNVYQNFTVDSVNLGTFSGSGGGGSPFEPTGGSAGPYLGQGSGGNGGVYSYYGPSSGTNGGGGGGGSVGGSPGPYILNQGGNSGGDGIVIIWFLSTMI